jgi:Fe-S cluster biogenesis protein NfuA
MESSAVENALEGLRPGLAADGFDLRLLAIEPGGRVDIVLEAKPDACLDCLVPQEMLVQIIEAAIRERDTRLDRVVLTRSGFADD